MFCQDSQNFDSVSSKGINQIPIGSGLNGGSPSLPVVDGSIALNRTNNQLYYVGGNVWKAATGDLVTLAAVGASPNANGASITGQVLNLQPASASFPGVVTTLAQTFSGVKSFPNGIIADGTNYTALNPTAGTAANDGLLINNPASTINLEFADETHNGILSTTIQQIAGRKVFNDSIIVGPLTPSLNVFVDFNYFAYHDIGLVPVTGGVTGNVEMFVQRVGHFVSLSFGELTNPASGAGVATVTPVLPVEFRPFANRGGVLPILVYGVYGTGTIRVSPAGVVTIGAGLDNVFIDPLPFIIGPGVTGWADCSITYPIN
mgnify:CR=1 FL=1